MTSPSSSHRKGGSVGASQNPTQTGLRAARIGAEQFQGACISSTRKAAPLRPPVYASIQQAPDPLDLAICHPAQAIPRRWSNAASAPEGRSSARAVPRDRAEGAALEAEACRSHAAMHAPVGPNSIGCGHHLRWSHLPAAPETSSRGLGLCLHSGRSARVIDWARGQGFGLSRLVSLGNQAMSTRPMCSRQWRLIASHACYPVPGGVGRWPGASSSEAGRITRHKPIHSLQVGPCRRAESRDPPHRGLPAGERFQRRFPPRRGDPRRDQRRDVRLGARPGLVPRRPKGAACLC